MKEVKELEKKLEETKTEIVKLKSNKIRELTGQFKHLTNICEDLIEEYNIGKRDLFEKGILDISEVRPKEFAADTIINCNQYNGLIKDILKYDSFYKTEFTDTAITIKKSLVSFCILIFYIEKLKINLLDYTDAYSADIEAFNKLSLLTAYAKEIMSCASNSSLNNQFWVDRIFNSISDIFID